jgi:isocitrate dehydrogenase
MKVQSLDGSSQVSVQDPAPGALVRDTDRDPTRPVPVTVAEGDGIGPEIMSATLRILDAAGARLAVEKIEVGKKVYLRGVSSGIESNAWESLRRTKVLLKAPITTPQGGGYKSLNVTMRKTLGLYANVRPCRAYAPFVSTRHPEMDLVIVRENEEDTYGGIEHRQTDEVVQCLKLISRPGCERIVRYAFEYAVQNGRRRVTCMTKDNIMKLTDGLFRRVFEEVAAEYAGQGISADHMIIDIGAARLADTPEKFDVIVTPNLYGDIISDVAAQISGSVGLAGSANIGPEIAMFEAIHGSAPDIAGTDIANPSGLLLSAVMMLRHLGQGSVALQIHNAWLRTIEDGMHTRDIVGRQTRQVLGTQAFADAVIERLGLVPTQLPPVKGSAPRARDTQEPVKSVRRAEKKLVGFDVFLHWSGNCVGRDPDKLADIVKAALPEGLRLSMITNRGVKVWPDGLAETFCTDHWRCRVLPVEGTRFDHSVVVAALASLAGQGIDFVKTEHLYTFDGVPGYSLGQGE